MSYDTDRGVRVTFAEGVRADVADLVSKPAGRQREADAYVEAIKRRIAELLLECQRSPYIGELMGKGRHRELEECRRVRFDIPSHDGKPRFRLIYRNEPSDGAPAECRWLAIGPRAGLRAHRDAQIRSRRGA